MFSSTQVTCDYCGKSHKGSNCLFDLKDTMTMKQVLAQMKYDRDFELAIQFHDSTVANLKPLETPDFEEVNLCGAAS